MATVYINLHPKYDYAMAVIDGFVDLKEYVINTDWLCWAPSPRSKRQIMISRVRGVPEGEQPKEERIKEFIKHVQQLGCSVMTREERGEAWNKED